jgi:hypothetical protein
MHDDRQGPHMANFHLSFHTPRSFWLGVISHPVLVTQGRDSDDGSSCNKGLCHDHHGSASFVLLKCL